MDTNFFIVHLLPILQFSIGDNIVSSKDWSRFMTGDGHEGEMIVSGKLRIVDWAMPKIMEGEVSKLWLYDCLKHWSLKEPWKVLIVFPLF